MESKDVIFRAMSEFSWMMLIGVASFGVKFLRDLSKSVEQLNQNIMVVIARIDGHEKRIDDHEQRLRGIEK